MAEPLIPGGYILLSRKLLDSGIFEKPPLYIKVWIYLLSRAQYKEYKGLKKGQLWTSMPEIQKVCSYKVGYRTEMPSIKEIRDVIDWLRSPGEGHMKGAMIGTVRGTHGLLVTIYNYSTYQDSDNYEGRDEGTDENSAKGEKRAEYKQECKRINIYIAFFDAFWEAYPKKNAKAAAQKVFNKLKVDDNLLSLMLNALEKQKLSKQWQDKQFIPHASTWLNQRRWEDETEEPEKVKIVDFGGGFQLE